MMPLFAALACVSAAPVDLGDRTELFVDRFLIERMTPAAELRLNEPVRREVVLVTDKPWEGPDSAYYTVLRDGPRIRIYYRGLCPTDLSEGQVTCVAESTDGVTFTRPSLGLFEFNGSKANNIVWRGLEAHNFAPFIDTRPAGIAAERYRAVAGLEGKLYAFLSDDGLKWIKLPAPIITDGAFDSLNIAFWDALAGKYRCYSRYFADGVRAIQSCTSEDFYSWTPQARNAYADGVPKEHFYTNAVWPCPGAPHILLSFPKRFVPERTKLPGYKEPGVSDAVFMTSRDGANWDRTFLEAWVRPGRDQHNWSQRSNMPAWGIVETSPDEFSMYISEHYGWPENRLRRLTIPRHRFASIHAGREAGEVLTKPITLAGTRLILNYATSAVGWVKVEVQDVEGKPLPGLSLDDAEPLFGDELDGRFTWRGGKTLAEAQGKGVRLRFVLSDADVYAFRAAK